jgi:hypothetical protein
MQEHLSRARLLIETARAAQDADATYRLQLAAVYSCRAVVELMFEAAEKQEIRKLSEVNAYWSRKELEDYVAPKLPFYALVERIRIHDFHRFGIAPPDPMVREVFLGGPMKLVAKKGAVALAIGPNGPLNLTSGTSEVKAQRPLLNQDGQFFDEDSSTYVALNEILERFTTSAHAVVAEVAASAA